MRIKNKSVYHWIVTACCCGLMLGSVGISINCSGVFFSPVAKDFGVGYGDAAMAVTIMNLVTGLVGPMVMRFGRRGHVRLIIGLGMFLTVASLAAWSVATSMTQLYILSTIQGIGNAMFGVTIITMVVGNWFSKGMGLALGIALSFSGVAGAVFNPMLQSIITGSGWRTAHLLAAGIVLVAVLPALFLLRAHPQDKGFLPYGATEDELTSAAKAAVQDLQSPAKAAPKPPTVFFLIVCAVGILTAFVTGMGQHMSGYATSVGLSATVGAYMISTTMVGNMTSKLMLGVLCDTLGTKRASLLFLALIAVGFTLLGLFSGAGMVVLIAAAFFVGCSYSIGGIGLSQVTRTIFGAVEFNKVYAYVMSASLIGSSISSAVIGYAYDYFGTYTVAALTCAAFILLSAVLLIWMFRAGAQRVNES